MCELLAGRSIDWERVEVFQTDERIAPDGDENRNLTHLLRRLPPEALARLRPLPVRAINPELAAAEYEAALPSRFDLVHLGLGPDGHTASLVPGDPVLEVHDRDIAITARPYQGTRRMTLTRKPIGRARELLYLVTGEEKREPLARLLSGEPSLPPTLGGEPPIPAALLPRERALVIADEAAAGGRR
jgi:6-phosphogluconolactonase